MTSSKKRARSPGFPVVHRYAAGIDVGSRFHVVAVMAEVDSEPVRTFKSFTGDLHRLALWLKDVGITTVAMESTGIYWVPVFEILEGHGFEVLLVNARHVKNVPGRKTDVNDAQWIQRLHQHGLLRGSFRPRKELAALRAYLRLRARLVDYASAHIQHMQKALMLMNVQLHHVVTDITGVTGMRIIRGLISGVTDPVLLSEHRDPRCKASKDTIRDALTGHLRAEHLFALQQAVELYDVYQVKIADCDSCIEKTLATINADLPAREKPIPPRRGKVRQRGEPAFDVRTALYSLTGVDLTQIHGFGPHSALRLISECGDDMTRWPTVKHFTSWLTLAPGNKISGGKILSSKTRRSGNRAAALLRISAVNVGKTSTALGAFYRRLAARVGKSKAVTATARKLAVLFYNALRNGIEYRDPGADYYEERYKSRVIQNLRRRAKSLGYQLVEGDQPEGTVVS